MDEAICCAVWDYESSKSRGPDGVNFSFIKQFWETIKADFIAFLDFSEYMMMTMDFVCTWKK